MQSVNPATGKVIKEFPEHSEEELDVMVQNGYKAFKEWRNSEFMYRKEKMKGCAEYLRTASREFAGHIVEEMGKPFKEAVSEIEKCAWVCDYYADHAEAFLQDEVVESDAGKSFIAYQPLGIVLAIMPWNFPFWQVFRFAAPGLMAGNAGILKHASNVPQCALDIEKCFKESGFPKGLFQTALVGSDKVNYLVDKEEIKAVTLTGSEKAGSLVAAEASKKIKKTVLELGGSDAFVVLEDADLDLAVQNAVKSRLINSGQSCIAAKRFIIVEKIYDEFLSKLKDLVATVKYGDPQNEETDIGPLARKDLRDEVINQLNRSVEKGAQLVFGGKVPERDGAFMEPAILTNVKPGMPAYEEELFGPVFSIIKVKDEQEAIKVANDSRYGLGGSVWSENKINAIEVAKKIESGAVFVNGMVKSDPRLPFGGIKKSGYGRELSKVGIREFVNVKTVWVK